MTIKVKPIDANAFRDFCKTSPPFVAARLLWEWVQDGQPEGFLDGYTSRGMCRVAAECYRGRYGGNWVYMDFYEAMWRDGILAIGITATAKRKARHIRCCIPLDADNPEAPNTVLDAEECEHVRADRPTPIDSDFPGADEDHTK